MQQKIQIFIIFFFSFAVALTAQVDPLEDCLEGATAGNPVFSGIPEVVYTVSEDSFDPEVSELAIDSTTVGQSGFTDYAYVVTGPAVDGKEPVVGVTYDGTWDFGQYNLEPRPAGRYCFTGFGYNQSDMDVITANVLVQSILNKCSPVGEECVTGGEKLDEILDCLVNLENSTCPDDGSASVYDVDTVLHILREQVSVAIGYVPCVMISSNQYCVDLDIVVIDAISEFGFLGFEGIYPNPVVNEATVVFNAGEHDFVNVEIYNLTGQRIYTDGYLAEPGKNEYRINVSDWNQGYYFIKLDDGKEVITKRMIVNH